MAEIYDDDSEEDFYDEIGGDEDANWESDDEKKRFIPRRNFSKPTTSSPFLVVRPSSKDKDQSTGRTNFGTRGSHLKKSSEAKPQKAWVRTEVTIEKEISSEEAGKLISTNEEILLPEDDSLPFNERSRNKVINEIIVTEREYVFDLFLMIQAFFMPLEMEKILDKKELNIIFCNLSLLINVNKELLSDLQKQIKNPENPRIGSAFIRMSAFLKMYSVYCNNHQTSLDFIKSHCKTNPAFNAFCQERLTDPTCRNLPLTAYLIKPIQRVCKYPLFLREVLKFTSQDDEDYKDLQDAFNRIEGTVAIINESKRTQENQAKILEIQNRLEGGKKIGLVTPSRRFIAEAVFTETDKSSDDHEKEKEKEKTYYFLFNDLLLRAVKSRQWNPFQKKTETDNPPLKSTHSFDLLNTSFEIVIHSEVSFEMKPLFDKVLVCNSEKELQSWTQKLEECIRSISEKKKEKETTSANIRKSVYVPEAAPSLASSTGSRIGSRIGTSAAAGRVSRGGSRLSRLSSSPNLPRIGQRSVSLKNLHIIEKPEGASPLSPTGLSPLSPNGTSGHISPTSHSEETSDDKGFSTSPLISPLSSACISPLPTPPTSHRTRLLEEDEDSETVSNQESPEKDKEKDKQKQKDKDKGQKKAHKEKHKEKEKEKKKEKDKSRIRDKENGSRRDKSKLKEKEDALSNPPQDSPAETSEHLVASNETTNTDIVENTTGNDDKATDITTIQKDE